MDAYSELLRIFSELERGDGPLEISPELLNAELTVWAKNSNGKNPEDVIHLEDDVIHLEDGAGLGRWRNVKPKVPQKLGFINPLKLIAELDRCGQPHRSYGDFHDASTKNPVLMVSDYEPVSHALSLVTMTVVELMAACTDNQSGIGITYADNGYTFASQKFIQPVIDAVVKVISDQARQKFYAKAIPFPLSEESEDAVKKALADEALLISSLDIGEVVVGDTKFIILHLNLRDDIEITDGEIESVKNAFTGIIASDDAQTLTLSSIGTPRLTNPHIRRMGAQPVVVESDASELFRS